MDAVFIEKGSEDVAYSLRSIDKSLLPVETVETSEEILLDGDSESDELGHSSTFCKKGSTFLLKGQPLSNKTRMREIAAPKENQQHCPLVSGKPVLATAQPMELSGFGMRSS